MINLKSDILYVMDTETTGFKTTDADAIEVSALKVKILDNGSYEILDTFDSYINPCYPLPESIVEFNKKNNTGIDDELLSKAPKADEVARMLYDFIGTNTDFTIVGHNIPFDIGFLDKLYQENLDIPFKPDRVVDTLALARKYIHNASNHKLGTIFELTPKTFSEECPNFHTSVADCFATLDVLKYIKDNYAPHKPSKTSSGPSKPAQEEQSVRFDTIDGTVKLSNDDKQLKQLKRETADALSKIISVEELSMLMCRDIAGIAVITDKSCGRIVSKDTAQIAYSDSDFGNLATYIELSLSTKTDGIMISKSPSAISIAAYVKSKSGITTVYNEETPLLRTAEDVYDLQSALSSAKKAMISHHVKYDKDKAKDILER